MRKKGDEPMKRYEDFVSGIKEDVEVPVRVQARIEETLSNLPENEANCKKKGGRREQRSWMSTAAAVILVIMVLSGCAVAGEYLSMTKVQVLVTGSQDTGNMMYGELMDFEKVYEEEHPDIDIVVTLLSDEKNDQTEARMKKVRTEIMAGDGYDLYIQKGTSTNQSETTYLFQNVNKAMQSGVFASLNKYMEEDERWNTMKSMQKAMDAGTYHGKQYVIPLEVEFPMFMQEKDTAIDYSEAKNLRECAEITRNSKNNNVIADFMMIQNDIKGMLLEPAMDYESNEILMEKEPFVDYMTYVQNSFYNAPYGEEERQIRSGMPSMLFHFMYLWEQGEIEKPEVDFQLVPGISGEKVATVSSYGAVSMNSTKKEAAYDFLVSFMNRDIEESDVLRYIPVNQTQLKNYLDKASVDSNAVIDCCNNLDKVVFLSEGSLLTEEKLKYYLQSNSPKPEPDFEETVSKIYDEIYQTYETILKE